MIKTEQIRTFTNSVNQILYTCDLLSRSVYLYPEFPKQLDVDEIQRLKLVISRHGKRCAYYAVNFIDNYLKILINIKDSLTSSKTLFVEDDIFFDFDAFVFSAKSIVEGNIIKLGKKFQADIREEFNSYSQVKFKNFIKNYLTPIRDEAVHLNNFGTAIGSIVHVEKNNTLFFQTTFSYDVDLIKMFSVILEEIKDIILNIAKYIVRHESSLWGKPNTQFVIDFGDKKLTIVDILGDDFRQYL